MLVVLDYWFRWSDLNCWVVLGVVVVWCSRLSDCRLLFGWCWFWWFVGLLDLLSSLWCVRVLRQIRSWCCYWGFGSYRSCWLIGWLFCQIGWFDRFVSLGWLGLWTGVQVGLGASFCSWWVFWFLFCCCCGIVEMCCLGWWWCLFFGY